MGLKIAVAGKGGVGKTTIVGSLARIWARDGVKVIAVDADPAAHLHSILEIPRGSMPTAISSELDLIEERTGARPGVKSGPFFRLNPKVDDIPGKYSVVGADGVRLLVLGTIKAAGSGCFCPENALLRVLLEHMILERNEAILVDMEAGLEQFGRSTCRGVDILLVVVEPGLRSVETASRIVELSREMGVTRTAVIANRVHDDKEERGLSKLMAEHHLELFHSLRVSQEVAEADLEGKSVFQMTGAEGWIDSIRQLSNKISSILGDGAA